jgi:nifR3 family TIM-barrel protein
VSDHPFRRICAAQGADLTYVEMLSATALVYESRRTYDMMKRHPAETKVGIQLTGKSADEVARAVAILDRYPFETIDINMGCPVAKVTKAGCGSAILRDPGRVFETVRLARSVTSKPLSVKIRLGWDQQTITWPEVTDAAERAGAAWVTTHGRLRNDDYSAPVDLSRIAALKSRLKVPVIGNGNIFGKADADWMVTTTGVDGVMVSRGALGNPWIFREIKGDMRPVTLDEWVDVVTTHLRWQGEEYGEKGQGAVCMRKHLLWYVKGWPGAKKVRAAITQEESIAGASQLVLEFAEELARQGLTVRDTLLPDGGPELHGGTEGTQTKAGTSRFVWDPKFEMDRQLDRGVGADGLVDSM